MAGQRSLGWIGVFFVLVGLAAAVVDVKLSDAAGAVYIRANGAVEGTDKIATTDNITYTFTDSLNHSIVVERSHILIDGAGHAVHGAGAGLGFSIKEVDNVTIQHCIIHDFAIGIHLNASTGNALLCNTISGSSDYGIYLHRSSHTLISANGLRNNFKGIQMHNSSSSTITGNSMAAEAIYNDYGIKLEHCSNTTIAQNAIEHNDEGIYLANASRTTISHNIIINNYYGIIVANSSSNTISGNQITNDEGVRLRFASANIIRNNNISGNGNHGLWLFHSSSNVLTDNTVNANGLGGFWMSSSSNNIISRNYVQGNNEAGIYIWGQNNMIIGNTLANNDYGVWLMEATNTFVHNNFVTNTQQVYASDSGNGGVWDDGGEGNFWTDYAGADTNHDGVGDSWHEIVDNHADRFPLMGHFHCFNTSTGDPVNVVSNSTITHFSFSDFTGWITIQVRNATATQRSGFCRVTIPHSVISPAVTEITVVINASNVTPLHFNNTVYDNGTHLWIYVAYPHSLVDITIVHESPALLILPMLLITAILTTTSVRCRRGPEASYSSPTPRQEAHRVSPRD